MGGVRRPRARRGARRPAASGSTIGPPPRRDRRRRVHADVAPRRRTPRRRAAVALALAARRELPRRPPPSRRCSRGAYDVDRRSPTPDAPRRLAGAAERAAGAAAGRRPSRRHIVDSRARRRARRSSRQVARVARDVDVGAAHRRDRHRQGSHGAARSTRGRRGGTKPFVPINCAAIPNELMEAELFGYARGAFSGAVQRYDGQLMAAAGGTVFLDEIDDTPLETQVKLLRVLEDRVVSRLGENEWHAGRLPAARRDQPRPARAHRGGLVRRRSLRAPRDRHDSAARRCASGSRICRRWRAHFMDALRARTAAGPPSTTSRPDALRALEAYPWPGNIRELRNVLYETLVYKRAGRRAAAVGSAAAHSEARRRRSAGARRRIAPSIARKIDARRR